MITSIEEAKNVLAQDAEFMITMEMDGSCWITAGVCGSDNILVADGKRICRISEDVFNELAKDMEQEYCDEYFQKRTESAARMTTE